MKRFLLPCGIFLLIAAFLGIGLHLNPQEIPSPLINKPAPTFSLPQLDQQRPSFTPQSMLGKVWILNVWASWCAPCREELPVLINFSKASAIPLVGLNYTDARADATQWLLQFGNPYQLSVSDPDGRVGMDYGVYGVPETFVIDKQGLIRKKYVGPLTAELINDSLLPLLSELNHG